MKLTKYVQDLQVLTDKIRFIKPVLKPLSKLYYNYVDASENIRMKKLREAFNKHGLEVLDCLNITLGRNGYKYSLAFGTMLGAVREHGFIKHDLDIDIFMWIEDFDENLINCLKEAGFVLKHTFLVDGGKYAREDTIEKDGVQIDIFYLYPALEGRQYPYCCDFLPREHCRSREQSIRKYGGLLPRRLEMPVSSETLLIQFEKLLLPVLANAHEFLSFRYGLDYMTPNSKWTNGANPHIIPWIEKNAEYIEYR